MVSAASVSGHVSGPCSSPTGRPKTASALKPVSRHQPSVTLTMLKGGAAVIRSCAGAGAGTGGPTDASGHREAHSGGPPMPHGPTSHQALDMALDGIAKTFAVGGKGSMVFCGCGSKPDPPKTKHKSWEHFSILYLQQDDL